MGILNLLPFIFVYSQGRGYAGICTGVARVSEESLDDGN